MQQTQFKKVLLWTLVFFTASVFLCFSKYQSSSNDSKYYSTLVTRYYDKSWKEILTPKWGENYWSFDPQTYMRDQLPGQIVMGTALAKVGVPAQHALHLIETVFLLTSVFLIMKTAAVFISCAEASALLYALMLIPLSFSYNLRANHEAGILFFSALALYSGLKLSSNKIFSLTSILSCFALMWIKGPFFIFGFVLTTWGVLLTNGEKKYFRGLFTLMIAAVAMVGSGLLYEKLFQAWTGEPFFAVFWRIQIQERAMGIARHSFLIQKYLNFQYYFLKYLAYSLPWSLTAIVLVFRSDKERLKSFLLSPLSLCLLGAGLAYLGVFSMSERIAGRYAFPGYYFFSAWLVLLCYSQSAWLQKIQAKLESTKAHYMAAGLWLLAFGLHFI